MFQVAVPRSLGSLALQATLCLLLDLSVYRYSVLGW